MIVSGLFLLFAAAASPLPMGVGGCDDGDFRQAIVALGDALGLPQTSRRASKLTREAELVRQLDQAHDHFHNARYALSQTVLDQVEPRLTSLEPGDERWNLQVRAYLLRALIHRGLDREAEGERLFRAILAIEPGRKLDEYYFAPSVRSAFDVSRQAVSLLPKVRLTVKTSEPGAEVFLQGKRVGVTPFEAGFPQGSYRLEVAQGDARAFARTLELTQPIAVTVDLPFEASVEEEQGLCLPNNGQRAVELGATLGHDEVIVVRRQATAGGGKWWVATLVSTKDGAKLREGAVRVVRRPTEAALRPLASYLTTGTPHAGVEVQTEPIALSQRDAVAGPFPETLRRPLAYASFGLAGAAFAAAGVLRLVSEPDIAALQQRTRDGYVAFGDSTSLRLDAELRARADVATGLLIGGGLAAGAGALLLLAAPSAEPPRLGVVGAISSEGGAVQLSGSF